MATGEPGWQAIATGAIVSDGRCLTLVTRSGETYLAIWPPDYKMVRDPEIRITAPDGSSLTPGQNLAFYGGEVGDSDQDLLLRMLDGDPPPAECRRSLYWLVTGFGSAD